MKAGTLACYALCLAAATFLGRFELHTDDTGVEVLFILFFTFVFGFWHPRNAWQWAVLIAGSIPVSHLISGKPQSGLLVVAAVVLVIALGGSYAGVLFRKGISPPVQQHRHP